MLGLFNFQEQFIIETNASGLGIGVGLMQQGQPIAYISRTLAPKCQSLSTYEKELLALVYDVENGDRMWWDHISSLRLIRLVLNTSWSKISPHHLQSKLLPK